MFDYNNPWGMYGIGSNYGGMSNFSNQPMNLSPNMQNAPQQAQSVPQSASHSNMDWIRVNTMEDVERVTVQPNSKAWIMLANEPVFVLKTADGMGLTTTDAYRFEKVSGDKKPEYVTREEFNNLINSIKKDAFVGKEDVK